MSTKEEKPTLAGAQIKTRKRNIVVPADPGSFANAVVTICEDAREDTNNLEQNLQAAVKGLETAELDFSRYGETLFEVFIAGGRLAGGGNVVPDGKPFDTSVMYSDATREAIVPYVKVFQVLIRRRPFLIKALENTLCKLIKSLEFYQEDGRKKIAIVTARVFAMKLGVLPDKVLMTLLNDRMVAKGTILSFVTEFFKDFLGTDSIDDLVLLLRKARLDDRLMDLCPPQKRNHADFNEHFKAEGLSALVEYNNKKAIEVHQEELKLSLSEMIMTDPPMTVKECIDHVKTRKSEWQLPDVEVVKVIWTCVSASVPTTGKNAQQILGSFAKQIKTYGKLITDFCNSARLENALLVHVQVTCYEDSKLLKLFSGIVRIMYEADLIAEDTIQYWYKKGSNPKGRSVFTRDMEPFIKWLEEAEEEDDEEEEEE